jgi:hypothetical protein
MGSYSQKTKVVTLAASGGAGDTQRVWIDAYSEPLVHLTIALSSRGTITAAGNLGWEVFYGGGWDGTPFHSNHIGGVSQGSGTIVGSAEVLSLVYDTVKLLPANNLTQFPTGGFPIVVELKNSKAAVTTIYVTFIYEFAGANF